MTKCYKTPMGVASYGGEAILPEGLAEITLEEFHAAEQGEFLDSAEAKE